MSKTIKIKYDDNLTFYNLLKAHVRTSKNKNNKKCVMKFNIDLETNILSILNSLKKDTYRLGNYFVFKIYEPKERIISALPYKDRIVQNWYIEEFIKPYIVPRFINDSYACIEGKGTHKAVYKTQKYMRLMKRQYNSYYIIKCDIAKYFYSIDKDILFKIMKKYIKDEKLIKITKIFIYDSFGKGIPIGNYTSQSFANIYLNELDKYVKEKLKVKYYIRYMDDFIILEKGKVKAKLLLKEISIFLNKELHLNLNNKSRIYPNKMGINFCGYRIFETHILLRNRSKKKIKNNIKIWKKLYINNKINYKKMELSFNSWLGHARHANSFNLINKVYDSLKMIITK